MHTNKRYWLDAGPWVLLIAGAITALWLQFHYNKFIEIDSLSYINIGELYAAGLFQKAINGYWSPLYSWVIAVFIKLGVRPHVTCYYINAAAALACFYFIQKHSRRYLKNPVIYLLFQLCMIVLLLFYALSELSPDLMGTAATLWFLTILWSGGFYTSYRLPVWAGIAGAIMFLAKSYNFVFLHGLFFILLIAGAWSPAKRMERRYQAPGLAFLVFWCVSLVWLVPLSIHEGKPVFSTAGGYSHNYAGPGHPGHPIVREVIPPPFEEAYTAWLNPANQLDDRPWSAFGSVHNAFYQLRSIIANAIVLVKILNSWYIRMDVLLICAGLLALYDKKRLLAAFSQARLWVLVLVIYPLGYLPFFVEGRYIYIEALLILLLFFYLLEEAGNRFSATARKKILFDMLLAVAVPVFLAIQSVSFTRQKIRMYQYAQLLYAWQQQLPFLRGERIVTDKGNYILATQLCYTMNARLYGVWRPEAQDKVRQYRLGYLLTSSRRQEPFVQLVKEIAAGKESIYVYRFVF